MSQLLHIISSPAGERSFSNAVGDSFIKTYKETNSNHNINEVNLFEKSLPAFDGNAQAAKFAVLRSGDFTPEQKKTWETIENVIHEFKNADKYVFTVPMWNFGIPYALKHYIDVLVQPGYTFTFTPEKGYEGLVKNKKAVVIYSRGGDYSDEQSKPYDLQHPYFEAILNFIGITDQQNIFVQPTLMGGEEVANQAKDKAIQNAIELAKKF